MASGWQVRRALSPNRQSTTLSSMAFWRSPRTWFQRLHTPRDRYRSTVQAVRSRCIGGAALRSPSLYAMVRWREIADFIPIGISGLRASDIKRIQSHAFYGSHVIQICGAMVWEQRDPRIPCASTHKPCMRELVSPPSPLITVATPPQLSRFQAHQDRTKSGVPSCHATPCTKTIELLMRIGAYTHFRP